MKAITYTHYGSADVLQVREVDKPVPKDNEVLIRVQAVEATKSDVEMRSFRFAVKWFWLPLRLAFGIRKPKRQILGGYFSGTIVALGENVSQFSEGEDVFGSAALRLGAYGEYIALPESYAITGKPRNMGFTDAACVPLGGLNALHFMRLANIRSGDTVLINGAGGSIGTHAIQIAKSMGAEVTAVDTGIKETKLRQLGADHFIDYTKENFITLGKSYDVIFDMVAGSSYTGSIRCLKTKGCYLSANPRLAVMLRSILTTRFTSKSALFSFAKETKAELEALKDMIEKGYIKSIVDCVFSMEQASEAHERVETEQRLGAIVIAMGNDQA